MDRPVGVGLDFVVGDVEGVTENVEDVALDAVAYGDGDGSAGVNYSLAADEAVGLLQGNCAYQ